MSIFTIIGGVGGFIVGGPAGASVGASLGAGIDGKNAADDQAANQLAAGQYNAAQATALSTYNADSTRNAAKINMGLVSLGAQADSAMIMSVAKMNAMMQMEAGFYNAGLLKQDAASVLEAMEFDVEQTEKQYRRIIGATEVGYASSGVRIDIETDTSALVLLDIDTERELETMIITRNGEEQAQKLLNAAARGEFEGTMAAAQIMFEGNQRASSTLVSGAIQSAGIFANSELKADQIRYEGAVASNDTLYSARTSAYASKLGGQRALVNGLVQGGIGLAGMGGGGGSSTPSSSGAGTTIDLVGGPR